MKRTVFSPLALAGALTLGACSDGVLEPETSPAVAPTQEARTLEAQERAAAQRPSNLTIAQIAEQEGFTLLLAAVEYIAETNPGSPIVAGLLDDDQYTVFAPTDQAFLNLVGAVADLLDPDVLADEGPFAAIDDLLGAGTVEAVVAYHVTEGRRGSNSVLPRNRARVIETLLDGATFSVDSDALITAVGNTANFVEMDGAPLIDISASNGIIHVIDAVILPIDLGL